MEGSSMSKMNILVLILSIALVGGGCGEAPLTNVKKEHVKTTQTHKPKQNTDDDAADAASGATNDATSGASDNGAEIAIDISSDFDSVKFLDWQQARIKADGTKPVYIVDGFDPAKAAYDLISKLSPGLPSGIPVLIKPNLGGFTWFKKGPDNGMTGRVTDVRFVEGIVKYLVEKGVSKITIAESWGMKNSADIKKMFRISGYEKMSKRHKQVNLVDLNYYGGDGPNDEITKPVSIPMPNAMLLKEGLVLPKVYVDHLLTGLVIDVPKLKTHRFAVFTAGMKNLMGTIGIQGNGYPHTNKWKMHEELNAYLKRPNKSFDEDAQKQYLQIMETFSHRLTDVYQAAHPHMTLIDGVWASQGDGLKTVSPVPAGVAIGSYNTVFADVVAAKTIGYWKSNELKEKLGVDTPPFLTTALKRLYPGADTADKIEIKGKPEIINRGLLFKQQSMAPFTIDGNITKIMTGDGTIRASKLSEKQQGLEASLSGWKPGNMTRLMTDWKGGDLPAGVETSAFCGYMDGGLVVVFHANYRQLNRREGPKTNSDIPDLFKWDVVEVFLDPDPSTPATYYEFELSPDGERLDIAVDLDKKKFDSSWESQMKVSSVLDEENHTWTAAFIIPWTKIGKPKSGHEWKINLFRVEGTGDNKLYMAWKPTNTPKPKFHAPSHFGKLIFE